MLKIITTQTLITEAIAQSLVILYTGKEKATFLKVGILRCYPSHTWQIHQCTYREGRTQGDAAVLGTSSPNDFSILASVPVITVKICLHVLSILCLVYVFLTCPVSIYFVLHAK